MIAVLCKELGLSEDYVRKRVEKYSSIEKIKSNAEEVKARGAYLLAVAVEGDERLAGIADAIFYVPKTLPWLQPSLTVIPLQLFAYYVASQKGCSIDQPKNLAKSVTVE